MDSRRYSHPLYQRTNCRSPLVISSSRVANDGAFWNHLLRASQILLGMTALLLFCTSKTIIELPVSETGQIREPNSWPWNQKRMGDGCKHVYLDLGANIGVHNRFLFQPQLYPLTSMRSAFDESFGSAEKRALPSADSVCAFAFEANPLHTMRLKAMEKCYLGRGHRLKVFVPNAVSDNTVESLYFQRSKRDNAVMWFGKVTSRHQIYVEVKKQHGDRFSKDEIYSIIQNNRDDLHDLLPDMANYTEVKAIDIGPFIHQHIKDRVYDQSNGYGTVMAKMDIEGSEFAVLPHMEKSGVLCKGIIDRIVTEFHGKYYYKQPNTTHICAGNKCFADYFGNYNKTQGGYKCGTPTFIEIRDSEEYLEDKENPLQQTCPDYKP